MSNNLPDLRVFPEFRDAYLAFEVACRSLWPDAKIPVDIFFHESIEHGHLYSDLPLRLSRRFHIPLEEVHEKLETAVRFPEWGHVSYVDGYANIRFFDRQLIPGLPQDQTEENRPTLTIVVVVPTAERHAMPALRLYARSLLQAGLATSLGYTVSLRAGSQSCSGTLIEVWKQLVEQAKKPRSDVDSLYQDLEAVQGDRDRRVTMYLSPRSFKAKEFRQLSSRLFHPESVIRMQCPTQRWCGDVINDWYDEIYSLAGLWYCAGEQSAAALEPGRVRFKEMENRYWFYDSLYHRLKELYSPGTDLEDGESFDGYTRLQACLPALMRQAAVYGMIDPWFLSLQQCVDQFLSVFHSPECRRRLNDDSLLPQEIKILSGAYTYLSDIIKHNSHLQDVHLTCEPL